MINLMHERTTPQPTSFDFTALFNRLTQKIAFNL